MSELKSLNALIRSYRRDLKKREQLTTAIKELQEQILPLDDQIKNTKKLIDHCVRTGESPLEATLRHTQEQLSKEPDFISDNDWHKPFTIHVQDPRQVNMHTTMVPDTMVNPCVIKSNISSNS
jgi:hypothetical protein